MREVVIAGGGTGGHVFPGLAVAEELRRAGTPVSWLGARRGLEAERVPAAGIPLRLLSVTGAVGRSRAHQIGAALRIVPSLALALRHLLVREASAVLAVGGYAALPGALAASALGLPVLLQEQNALPGLTNRFLAPWASAIACGFRQAVAAFPSLPAIFTGNPVRAEFFDVEAPPLSPLTVLVIGGSQGSAFLNTLMPQAFAELRRVTRLPVVVHQAGVRWEAAVRERYAGAGVRAEVVGFLERHQALARAVLVVARAGALTVSEIAAARRAALLVPFAAAAHNHQLKNAEALAETGAAVVLEEADATPAAIAVTLGRLLSEPEALLARGRSGTALARRDAARAVADLVLSRSGSPGGGHA